MSTEHKIWQEIDAYLVECKRRSDFKDETVLDYFTKNETSNDVFIRFADLPKLGINPIGQYDTPTGIFGYSLASSVKYYGDRDSTNQKTMKDVVNFPFAADQPYAIFFKFTGPLRLLDSGTYSYANLSRDVQQLIKIWDKQEPKLFEVNPYDKTTEKALVAYLTKFHIPHSNVTLGQLQALHDAIHMASSDNDYEHLVEHPLGLLWTLTRMVAYRLVKIKNAADFKKSRPPMWTKVLLSLGIGGIRDNGEGIIHTNEPAQTWIASGAYCQLLKIFKNVIPESEPSLELWETDRDKALKMCSVGSLSFPEDNLHGGLNFTSKLATKGKFPPVLKCGHLVAFEGYTGTLPQAVESQYVTFNDLRVTKLPDVICENLTISNCPKVTAFPKISAPSNRIDNIKIVDTPIASLPIDLPKVIDKLVLQNVSLKELPDFADLPFSIMIVRSKFDVRDWIIPKRVASVVLFRTPYKLWSYNDYVATLQETNPEYTKYKLGDKVTIVNKSDSTLNLSGKITLVHPEKGGVTYSVKPDESESSEKVSLPDLVYNPYKFVD